MLQAIPEVLIHQKAAAQSSSLLSDETQLLLYLISHNSKPTGNKELGKGLHDSESSF